MVVVREDGPGRRLSCAAPPEHLEAVEVLAAQLFFQRLRLLLGLPRPSLLGRQAQQTEVLVEHRLLALTHLPLVAAQQVALGLELALKQLLAAWGVAVTEQQTLLLTAQKPLGERRLLGPGGSTQPLELEAAAVVVEMA